MASIVPSSLIATAKSSGRCAPSLLSEDRIIDGGVFESTLLRCLDGGLTLSSDPSITQVFSSALKLAETSALADSPTKSSVLEQRRCLLLAATGSTAEVLPRSPTLKAILEAGFLVQVKTWLDDILSGSIGGMDLLLHLLTSIAPLPVTKEMVTTCRLGKAVVAVQKHSICVGTPNEKAITTRVQNVKTKWSEAVKALKNSTNAPAKRPSVEEVVPVAKKVKREAPTAKPALSNLLKKVQHTNDKVAFSTDSRVKEPETAPKEEVKAVAVQDTSNESLALQKKQRKIRWADSTGDNLAVSQAKAEVKAAEPAAAKPREGRVNRWAKKKDYNANDKELLMHARKTSQSEDDKEDALNAMAMMAAGWSMPQPLEDKVNPPIQVSSKELSVQAIRMSTVPAVNYPSENVTPIDPDLISQAEKALEILNMKPPNDIPFFSPPPAAPAPAFPAPLAMSVTTGATFEQVLALGLPMCLVGSNLQALQTLAAAPSLLTTFRDASGNFDQNGLINLVSTLTMQLAPTQTTQYGMQSVQQMYQPPPLAQPGLFTVPGLTAQPAELQPAVSRGYRGDQNLGEANLHLSGYGPTTTTEEIVALFAPYVHVTEVVPKGNFSFVNTRDPEGAKRAREALNGSLLGGMPCRINMATRKIKTPEQIGTAVTPAVPGDLSSLPRNSLGQVDYASVKDDRGNPATRNLFIAGYGPGTTEEQLRTLVAQYATVVSVALKTTFAFVNTTDRDAAVIARQSLGGTLLNGGPLRINFAKESGRLGTSFGTDGVYGPAGVSAATASSLTSYGRY
ncbi:hypothetical protein ACHAXN_010429 [Cyclotella atomus]